MYTFATNYFTSTDVNDKTLNEKKIFGNLRLGGVAGRTFLTQGRFRVIGKFTVSSFLSGNILSGMYYWPTLARANYRCQIGDIY